RLLILLRKNASGLAALSASIIWLALAPVPARTCCAMPYNVSPRCTEIDPLVWAVDGWAAGARGAGCGTVAGAGACVGRSGGTGGGAGCEATALAVAGTGADCVAAGARTSAG